MIAHRPESLRLCDDVFLLKDGSFDTVQIGKPLHEWNLRYYQI